MKSYLKLLFVALLTLVALTGCEKDSPTPFTVSESTFNNLTSQDTKVTIDITCTSSWNVESNNIWCMPKQSTGNGNASLVLNIEANLEARQRTALVTIRSSGTQKLITITQQPGSGAEYHYKMPIIFHLVESPTESVDKRLAKGYMAEIMGLVNQMFQDKLKSVDMNLEFVLATHDPQGKPLAEPGEDRISYTGAFPVDINYLMSSPNNDFKKMLWDANQYINVFVLPFETNSSALGISHIAITPASNYLPGTNTLSSSYLTLDNITTNFCLSLNRNFAHQRSSATHINANDFVVTTAHELAHHLGLLHAFAEDVNGMVDDCIDSDYCTDTPTYNRVAYEKWFNEYVANTPNVSLNKVVVRTDCSGATFESHNIMDYYVSWADKYTANQRARVRHVLTYGLLLPGPKIREPNSSNTKSIVYDTKIRAIE